MILADKIINERKKNGWSQEDLADKLSVSRQSVSKWEGAQSVPDLNRIIQMAELFNVSLDYLLKDEMEPEVPSTQPAPVESGSPARKVSMEEAVKYADRLLVVNKGKLLFDGKPAEIFKEHTQELVDIGMDIPETYKLAALLKSKGLNVPEGLKDAKELAKAIKKAKGWK